MSMPKLKPEFKAQWIAALRSGEYPQTNIGKLRFADSYCCLGVACHLVDPDGWEKVNKNENRWCFRHWDVIAFPPADDWHAWFVDGTDYEAASKALWELVRMNDTGVSFAEIADWIEQNL